MNQSVESTSASSVDPAQTDALHVDLAVARDQLSRVTAEYETMLSAQDTIQEDRDATAQLVAEAQRRGRSSRGGAHSSGSWDIRSMRALRVSDPAGAPCRSPRRIDVRGLRVR